MEREFKKAYFCGITKHTIQATDFSLKGHLMRGEGVTAVHIKQQEREVFCASPF